MRTTTHKSEFQFSSQRAIAHETWQQQQFHNALTADLRESVAREGELRREKVELEQRQDLLAQEFEHRLVNSLQMIVSLLSLQSQAATTTEAATQLKIAANRVAALGRVHQQLHLLDHLKSVELKQYLGGLCDDLSGLLFQEKQRRTITVIGVEAKLPTALGIPLGFIVNELVTNCAKYASGNITVRIERPAAAYFLSVSDDGPGLPADFDPASSKGLGMKIAQSLVQQIGGSFQFAPGDGGRGTCFTVVFAP